MKKALFMIAAAVAVFCCSCTKDLEDRVGNLEQKVEALEKTVNTNVSSIEQLVKASEKAITVTKVETTDKGYTIYFSDGTNATIANGIDGKDAVAPTIGFQEIDGVFYWTVNGELLKNGDKNVPVTGANGKDGVDGKTPQFKIENGAWKVSFDGETWADVPVTGTVAPTLVMTETDAAYVFTLGEQTITILKNLVIKVEEYDVEIEPGATYTFSYTISGADENTHVLVEAVNFEVKLDEAARTVTVTAPAVIKKGYIMIKAVRNTDSQYSAQYIVVDKAAYGAFGSVIVTNDNKYINW